MRRFRLVALLSLTAFLLLGFVGWWRHTSRPAYRLARGQALVREGKYSQARQMAKQLLDEGHTDEGRLLRGHALWAQASSSGQPDQLAAEDRLRYQQALLEFNQIRGEGAIRLQATALSGQCLLGLKQLAEAERVLRFVAAQQPTHVDAHRGLAAVYYDLGATAQAVTHLEEVARLAPDDGRPHRLLGLIHKDLDHAELAVDHYREALRRHLGEAMTQEVRVELAEVLVRLSRYGEALEQIEGRKPAPGDVGKAVALRAECFWGLGRAGEARDLLDQALKLNVKAPEVLRLRARLHLEAGEAKEAGRLLAELVAADRHDYGSRSQYALALEAMGQKKEAAEQRAQADRTRKLLEEMTQLTEQAMEKPQDAELRRRLAAVCEQLEKWELAGMWRSAADAVQAGVRSDGGSR
jgi:tetratricopeptide (TPR) repeat protein